MIDAKKLTALLRTETMGFTLIQKEAVRIFAEVSAVEALALAKEMYGSEAYQARMFATLIFGYLAAGHVEAYAFLQEKIVHDPDWRTQEMLARAFDRYCKDKGYEQSLADIKSWLGAEVANQRRAASEGLRIWTSRPYFKDHPEAAIRLLATRRADESEYVRKSVGNALRDISRRHPELIRKELRAWDCTDKNVAFTYGLAAKFLQAS